MLVYKAQQVIAASAVNNKPYEFSDDKGVKKSGTSIYSDVTVLGSDGSVAVIRLKGKSEDEVKAKVGKLAVGKAAEIQIKDVADNARGVLVLNAA
ncbi:MAG: hypothetical protein HYV95_09350 [Opitutae bacterium]|nr:hypothetical protein [Opitutae bacterium]